MRTTSAAALDLGLRALLAWGVPPAAAELQVHTLVEAELRGHPSHGLARLPRVIDRIEAGVTDPRAVGSHTWTAEGALTVDGQHGLGPVVAVAALDALESRVGRTGIAYAAIHSSDHLGMLSWYVERLASRGFIAIATTTSEALVHPWGGRYATQGPNPLALGIPALPEPLVVDMSTGVISMGKIHDYAARGIPLEDGWALDAAGEPTTVAHDARAGSIAPFGGAKGYALGIALEVLIASLSGSALGTDVRGTLDAVNYCTKGDIFIVIDARSTQGIGPTTDYLNSVRKSEPADPNQPILIPGDRARARRLVAAETGFDVTDETWNRLLERAG